MTTASDPEDGAVDGNGPAAFGLERDMLSHIPTIGSWNTIDMHLERLIRILEVVAISGGTISVSEISAATGYPMPSCYRLVQDLKAAGLLESPKRGLFRVGERFHRISRLDRSDVEVSQIAEPYLQKTADDYGVACFLARLRGQGVEITQVATPRDGAVSFLHPGLGFRPRHACSCAKVIAAYSGPDLIEDLFKGDLRQYTAFTRTDPDDLNADFQVIRERGYGECVQELELGICSVAAPVRLEELGVGLSVAATGSLRVFTEDFRSRIGAALITLADDLAAELGRSFDLDHPVAVRA